MAAENTHAELLARLERPRDDDKYTSLVPVPVQHTDTIDTTDTAQPAHVHGKTESETVTWSYDLFNHPLPITKDLRMRIQLFLNLFAALFVLIPFCYIPASFVNFIVKENASKAKQMQKLAGVGPVAYWASNFLWDVTNYLIITAAVMLVFVAYGNAEFVGTGEKRLATLSLIIMYGLSAIPLAYLYSFMFTNPTAAQVPIVF